MKIPKTQKSRYLLAAMTLLIAGTAAFTIGRYVVSDDAAIQAQVGPEETPQPGETPDLTNLPPPHPDIAALMTAVAEDNEKPLFTGTLNGITFLGEGTPFPEQEDEHQCANDELNQVEGSEARSLIRDSGLDFEVEVPSGLRLVREFATLCEDEVLNVVRVYSDNADENTRDLSIARSNRPPLYRALAPEDRLEATSIGGRDAVVVRSIHGINRTRIIMHDDDETLWTIIAEHIEEEDAVEIAEAIR